MLLMALNKRLVTKPVSAPVTKDTPSSAGR